MNDVYVLLRELKDCGARIYSEGEKLKLDIKKEFLTNGISDRIKYFRDDILMILKEKSKKSDFTPIAKIPAKKNYPISSSQHRLWILNQAEEQSIEFNIPGNMYLDSNVDINCFKRAIESVVDRHEILRTVFKEDETGEIKQWVLKKEDINFRIEHTDFRFKHDKIGSIQSLLRKDAFKQFDLEKGPLFTAGLVQIEEEDYVFYHNMHHIISDAWSMSVLYRDIHLFCKAYMQKSEPELKPLLIQYKDYSAWHSGRIEEDETHKKYWLDNLKGELPLLNLPSGKLRPKIKTYTGHFLNTTYISSRTAGKLKKYSEENGGTLFIGLLAAWNVLLYQYTSQTDIIIGTSISGRDHADLKDQIGFYSNYLALRNEIKSDDNFNSLFSRIRQTTTDAYSHEMYPFSRLVDDLDLVIDSSRSPIFDCLLVFHNNGLGEQRVELKKEEFSQIAELEFSTATFDIKLMFDVVEDYLSMDVIYNADVYEEDMVAGMIRNYKKLINSLLDNLDTNVSELVYDTDVEKSVYTQVIDVNVAEYPSDETLVDLFQAQVNMAPDNVAVVFDDSSLTYKELDRASNQLAHYLREKYDIQHEELVGIKQDRSEWLIVSSLAILKVGGAYVPIDPSYSEKQISHIEKDANCRVYLDDAEIEKFCKEQSKYNDLSIESKKKPSDLACVFYTSYSAGKSKGVLIEHRNIVRLIKAEKYPFDFNNKDVWIMSNSFAFDLSIWEVYGALLNGCKLVLVSFEVSQNIGLYLKLLDEKGVTVLNQPPFEFYNLSKEEEITLKRLTLRYVIFGGEHLSQGKLQVWQDSYPSCKLINMYGMAETSVHALYKDITQEEITHSWSNIVNTMPTVSCMVLDNSQNEVPMGISGEMYVGGIGVARGYLNLPYLTIESFIAHPLINGERLYRTGYKVKQLSNGKFEYLGSMDEQKKNQNYLRLEEIEYNLHPAINSGSVHKQNERMTKLNAFSSSNKYMIMVPPFQGQSIYFREFASFIQDKYNCYGVNYGIEQKFDSIPEISEVYANSIVKQLPNQIKKINIMGFSMGATIAFEISKILEKMNFKCEIFLIDNTPNSSLFKGEIISDQDTWVVEQIKIAQDIFPSESLANIKKEIINKLEIQNHFTTIGNVNSNISCLEGLDVLSTSMQLWEKFTVGKFRIEKIESRHDEIFKKENYNKLYDFIQKKN